jgi:putative nucleotidyltransferase with HDIG domain
MRSLVAKLYIAALLTAGAVILCLGLSHWPRVDSVRFLSYCAIALIASGLKVSLPSVPGTISMNFLFVLIGVSQLSGPETLVIGAAGMLAQGILRTRQRPKLVQVLFSAASVLCSIEVCHQVYHLPPIDRPAMIPIQLLLAAAAFFLCNTFSIAAVIGLTEGRRPWTVWRESYFWSFPNYLVGAAVAWTMKLAAAWIGWQASLLLLPVLFVIYRSHSIYVNRLEDEKRLAEEQRLHAEEVAKLHRRTIETLALAIEAKDQTTADHLQRVETYAIGVAEDLGFSPTELEALRAAALLHDIGKLAVPEHIISKPGKLTPDEFEKMKTHTVVGAELVEQIRFPYPVAPLVRGHHEKWNGSGYPDGLKGEEIPLGARILAAVDTLDALASDRQYRRAMPLDKAIEIVKSESGKSFDPRVVEVLVKRYIELDVLAKAARGSSPIKLSVDLKIERGEAPAAGFEMTKSLSNLSTAVQDLEREREAAVALSAKFETATERAALMQLLRAQLPGVVPYDAMILSLSRAEQLEPEIWDGESFLNYKPASVRFGAGLSGWVAENNRSIVNGNPSVEPGYVENPSAFRDLSAALAVPLVVDSGFLGVLTLYRKDGAGFSMASHDVLSALAGKLARAVERTSVAAK